jgi:hypothetical protein
MSLHPFYDRIIIEQERFAKTHEWDLPRVRQIVNPRLAQRDYIHQLFHSQPTACGSPIFRLHIASIRVS